MKRLSQNVTSFRKKTPLLRHIFSAKKIHLFDASLRRKKTSLQRTSSTHPFITLNSSRTKNSNTINKKIGSLVGFLLSDSSKFSEMYILQPLIDVAIRIKLQTKRRNKNPFISCSLCLLSAELFININ